MQMTQTQKTALKAHLQTNTNLTPATDAGGNPLGTPFVINTRLGSFDPTDETAIAAWYNLTAAPAYRAWDDRASVPAMRSAAAMAAYTPNDAVPANGTTTTVTNNQLLFSNQTQVTLLKQANAVFVLQGAGVLDASQTNLRQILSDCMTGIPTGAGGVAANAGWGTAASPGAVRLAMMRPVTNAEKVFCTAASGPGNDGTTARGAATNPDLAPVRDFVSGTDIDDVLKNG